MLLTHQFVAKDLSYEYPQFGQTSISCMLKRLFSIDRISVFSGNKRYTRAIHNTPCDIVMIVSV